MTATAGLLSCVYGLLLASGPACVDGACCPVNQPPGAVVRVVNTAGRERWYGSGTLVHKDDQRGIVLTCAHLFRERVGNVQVIFPGSEPAEATVLAVDRVWDLAALGIAPPSAESVKLAADYPRPGDLLRSCGYGPCGQYGCNQGQALGYVKTALAETYETLELSGSAREGDSGGPVFNDRGELAAVLWGTDGRTVGATYCGRVRKFLTALLARLRSLVRPPVQEESPPLAPLLPVRPPPRDDAADSHRPPSNDQEPSLGRRLEKVEKLVALVAGLKDRLERAEATVGEHNLRAIAKEVAVGVLADRAPGWLDKALPALLAALGWTGPPSLVAILAMRVGVAILRRRLQKRLNVKRTAAKDDRRPLQDDYARQLAEVYALSGRSPTADATLGREYDQELRQAEESSDATLARWARQLRQRVADRFYRIHDPSPIPAEPS